LENVRWTNWSIQQIHTADYVIYKLICVPYFSVIESLEASSSSAEEKKINEFNINSFKLNKNKLVGTYEITLTERTLYIQTSKFLSRACISSRVKCSVVVSPYINLKFSLSCRWIYIKYHHLSLFFHFIFFYFDTSLLISHFGFLNQVWQYTFGAWIPSMGSFFFF
jgi:hypothetical protein